MTAPNGLCFQRMGSVALFIIASPFGSRSGRILEVIDGVVQGAKRGVYLPVDFLVMGLINVDLIGNGVNGGAGVAQLAECGRKVGIDAGAQSGQDGGPQSGGLTCVGDGDGPVQDGGFDLHEEPVAGASADGADIARRFHAGVGEAGLEGVAGFTGQAFQHGPKEDAAVDVGAEADEGAPGFGIDIRGVGQTEVGEKADAEAAGRDRFGFGDEGRIVGAVPQRLSKPFDTGPGGVHAAQDVVAAGDDVGAYGVALAADFRIGERMGQGVEDGFGGAQGVEHGARPGNADG